MNTQLCICGIEELDYHSARGVTHVLSILDPDWPEPESFWAYEPHHRLTLRFHDAIEREGDLILPTRDAVKAILNFGALINCSSAGKENNLLIHCHAGVSPSTAAAAILLAQTNPDCEETQIFDKLLELRPRAWPNSRMIAFADALLQREGRLVNALGALYARQLRRDPQAQHLLNIGGRRREVTMAAAAEQRLLLQEK